MDSDALATEDSQVIRAVEVLNSFGMLLAQLFSEGLFILISTGTPGLFEIEISLRENRVLLHYLIEDVDV